MNCVHKAIERSDAAFMFAPTKELGPVNIECSDISPCPAAFILVFHLHRRTRLRRIGSYVVVPEPGYWSFHLRSKQIRLL